MVEDTEVWSGTSCITKSAENLSVSINMAKDAEVDGGGSGSNGGDNQLSQKITSFLEIKDNYGVSHPSTLWRW